jgi:hypothetical protein
MPLPAPILPRLRSDKPPALSPRMSAFLRALGHGGCALDYASFPGHIRSLALRSGFVVVVIGERRVCRYQITRKGQERLRD